MWHRLVKWVAGQAFTWGLKKLEEYGATATVPKPLKVKTRKYYEH